MEYDGECFGLDDLQLYSRGSASGIFEAGENTENGGRVCKNQRSLLGDVFRHVYSDLQLRHDSAGDQYVLQRIVSRSHSCVYDEHADDQSIKEKIDPVTPIGMTFEDWYNKAKEIDGISDQEAVDISKTATSYLNKDLKEREAYH